MANRHSHKKLRDEIRARMAARGESYQRARHRILASRARRSETPDLMAATYFGIPVNIAAYQYLCHFRLIVVSGCNGLLGLPWGIPSPLYVRADGLQ